MELWTIEEDLNISGFIRLWQNGNNGSIMFLGIVTAGVANAKQDCEIPPVKGVGSCASSKISSIK